MRIDQNKCIACLECIDYCPMEAIKENPEKGEVFIDEDECVECSCCLRADVCGTEAIWQPELDWPRILRAEFSDPVWTHPNTQVRGRGTGKEKTNELTGHYPKGIVGICVELGRPGIGTRFRDVEITTKAMASLGVIFEEANPIYPLFADPATGKLKDEVLNERVSSLMVEFKVTTDRIPEILKALKALANQVDTAFCIDILSLLEPDGTCEAERLARDAGFEIRPNGKDNVGLGRTSNKK